MPAPSPYATAQHIAILLKVSIDQLPELERKQGLPREGRDKYDLVKVIHWKIDRDARLLSEERAKRNIRTLTDIAYAMNVEPRTVNKLAKERGLPREAHGVYDVLKVMRWLCDDYEKQLKDQRGGTMTESQARKNLLQLNAELKQIELAAKRRQVVVLDDLKPVLTEILKTVRDKNLTLPKRAAPQVVNLETIAEVEVLLQDLTEESLHALTTIPDALDRVAKIAGDSLERLTGAQAAPEVAGQRVVRRTSRTKQRK